MAKEVGRTTGRVSDILESEGKRNGLRFKWGSGLSKWKGWVISRQDSLSLTSYKWSDLGVYVLNLTLTE